MAWERDPVTVSADDALAMSVFQRKRGPEPEEQQEAVAWLRSALAAGPRPAAELIAEANNGAAIKKRTLDRARKALQVQAYRDAVPGPWF